MDIKTIETSSRQSMINIYKEMKTICENYSCEFCNVCELGVFFKSSNEGIEGCNEYQRQITDYNKVCNQNLSKAKVITK